MHNSETAGIKEGMQAFLLPFHFLIHPQPWPAWNACMNSLLMRAGMWAWIMFLGVSSMETFTVDGGMAIIFTELLVLTLVLFR